MFYYEFIDIFIIPTDKIKFRRLEKYTVNRTEEHEVLKAIDAGMINDVFNL